MKQRIREILRNYVNEGFLIKKKELFKTYRENDCWNYNEVNHIADTLANHYSENRNEFDNIVENQVHLFIDFGIYDVSLFWDKDNCEKIYIQIQRYNDNTGNSTHEETYIHRYKNNIGVDPSEEIIKNIDDFLSGNVDDEFELNEDGLSDTLGANDLPDVPKWTAGMTRGHANPIDYSTKWSSGMVRGHANSLYEGFLIAKKPSAEGWLRKLLSELEPRETDNYIRYYKDNEWYVIYNKKNEELWFQYDRIYEVLLNQFHMQDLDIRKLVKRLVEEVYNLRISTATFTFFRLLPLVEEVYNLRISTALPKMTEQNLKGRRGI